MNSPAVRHVPDRSHRAADRLLPPLAALAAVALCLFLGTSPEQRLPRVLVFFGSWLVGLLLPRLFRYPSRVQGFAPYATTIAAGVAIVAEAMGDWTLTSIGLFCGLEGIAVGSVLRYRDRFRAEYRHFLSAAGIAVLLMLGIAGVFLVLGPSLGDVYRWALLVLAIATALAAWVTILRQAFEIAAEPPMWLMFRVSVAGPGLKDFPLTGPALVIANHASWLDPLLVAKIVPRQVTAMMTARFYDLPLIRPLVARVLHIIRVREVAVRREAPEVQEAIAALDAGKCVIIFPEGYLRRKEEQLLRRFGQGIWQILKARPGTPVVALWIEGVWGSYLSYKDGPPRKNKKFDIRRPIRIGVSTAETVPADILDDGLSTRLYLMNKVLDQRQHLGLPGVPPMELPKKEEDD
jgi:1-acyl-sn-glycerol-3-phosphate acyltransferase